MTSPIQSNRPSFPSVSSPPDMKTPGVPKSDIKAPKVSDTPTQIEPDMPSTETIDKAMEQARELQQGASFDPDQLDFIPDQSTKLKNIQSAVKQSTGGVIGKMTQDLDGLENQAKEIEAHLSELEGMAGMLSDSMVRNVTEKTLSLAQKGTSELTRLESKLEGLQEQMQRLGKEKTQEVFGPLEERLGSLQEQLKSVESRLQAVLPEEVQVDLPNMTAKIQLQAALGELSTEISNKGMDGKAQIDMGVFKAYLQASSSEGAEGRVEVNSGAFKALIEASSQKGVSGKMEVNTKALQMLIQTSDGRLSGKAQVQLGRLKAQLSASPAGASGRIEVNSEDFNAILEASSAGTAKISLNTEAFQAVIEASSDGAVSGKIALSTGSLNAVAEMAYKETLSAKLGVDSEHIHLEMGAEGGQINWSVSAQGDDFSLGLVSAQSMAGVMRVGDLGLEIGMHDASVAPPEQLVQQMEAMGGESVTSEMYGVMLTFPF